MEMIRNDELLYLSKRVDLFIEEIREAKLDPEWDLTNMRASFTRVYFPLEGEGILTFGNERVTITPGNVYIVPSGLNFSGFCPEKLNKIYIHLTLRRPDGRDLLSGLDRCLVFKDREKLIKEVERLYRTCDLSSVVELKRLLYDLLLEAISTFDIKTPDHRPYSPNTKAALAYIDEHLSANLTIGGIAQDLYISRLSLQKSFREDIGKPIGKYIDDCVISSAERLLLDPTLTVKEISERLGFCDQFYFSRKFTSAHGMSPRRFRGMHNE